MSKIKLIKFFEFESINRFKEINENEFIFCGKKQDKEFKTHFKCNKSNNITEISENEFNLIYYGEKYEEISKQLKFGLGNYCFCRSENGDYYFSFYQDNSIIFGFDISGKKIFELEGIRLGDCHDLYAFVYESPHFLWLAYPGGSKVIKFSLESNKEVFRIGNYEYEADENGILSFPEDLFIDKDYLYIPNMGNGKLYKLKLNTLEITKYLEFDEPLWSYLKVSNREFVLLESGFYELLH